MPPKLKPHKQVPAKVTAYVDEGIKELVELLNTFDEIQTTDSCEGDEDEYAYIYMRYDAGGRPDLPKMISFAQYLVDAIRKAVLQSKRLAFLSAETRVSIAWLSRSYPLVILEIPHDRIKDVINVFSSLPKKFSYRKGRKHK